MPTILKISFGIIFIAWSFGSKESFAEITSKNSSTKNIYFKEVSLDEVLRETLENSNIKKSSEFELKAQEEKSKTMQNHWLPVLYVDASAFQTNDPAKVFTGNLYQRAITQNDFNTSVINKSSTNQYTRSSIGVNLPLYQGGAGQSNADLNKNIEIAKKYDLKQIEVEQYSFVTANYIALVCLKEQKTKLQKIAKNIEEILNRYALRNQKNQIGYSGYLILEVSYNKTKSFIIDNDEKSKALYFNLKEYSFFTENDWIVKNLPIDEYIDKYLKLPLDNLEKNSLEQFSFKSSALKAQIDAEKNLAKIENAKNLPQVNLFAENYVFNGNRATRVGYSAGLNLRWNFFDPLTNKNVKISDNNINASRHQYLANLQNEKVEIETLNSQINALSEALNLAKKNDDLMYKNIILSKELFRNGSITASNLSDAIMKYLDNFVNFANMQMQLIDLHSKKLSKYSLNINDIINQ